MTESLWQQRVSTTDLNINNFINGKTAAISAQNSRFIEKHSPRDGSLLYPFPEGTSADVDCAVANAREAFDDGR